MISNEKFRVVELSIKKIVILAYFLNCHLAHFLLASVDGDVIE